MENIKKKKLLHIKVMKKPRRKKILKKNPRYKLIKKLLLNTKEG
jgi:hypothetical protein